MFKLTKILFIFLFIILNKNEYHFKYYIKCFLDIKIISIIIPVFNAEKNLEECLNTVINQTLTNIEIICIDDGSTDNSTKILEIFNKKDDRFVIVNQINKGSGYSRNVGIKISKGKFVSFFDSDDLYFNNFALESLYNKAIENNALICGGGMKKLDEDRNSSIYEEVAFQKEGFIKYIDYQKDFDYQRYIYNRNFLKRNKIYFPQYTRYQDPPFFINAMNKAKKFYTINNFTYIYRYKFKTLNLEQVIDMFYGLNDCLKLGEKLHLYKLYNLSLHRLNSGMFLKRIKIFIQNKKLKEVISKIIQNINKNIIKQENINFTINKMYNDIVLEL